MVDTTVVIRPKELEDKFRETIFREKGMKRGVFSEAVREAIIYWIERKTGEEIPERIKVTATRDKREWNQK